MPTSRRAFMRDGAAFLGASLTAPALFERMFRTFAGSRQSANRAVSGAPPVFVIEDFSGKFEPAYLSNGLIGIRPGPNPLAKAPAQVSGFAFTDVAYAMQSLSPAPYPFETDIRVGTTGTVGILEYSDSLKITRQALDMSTGELTTQFTFNPPNGPSLNVEVLQFASRSVPSLLCQEIRIVASADADVTFVPAINSEGTLATPNITAPPARTNIDLVAGFESRGNLSKLGVAVAISTPDAPARSLDLLPTTAALTRAYAVHLKAGEPFRFRTLAAMVTDTYHPEPALEAVRLAGWGTALSFDELRNANRAAWSDLWRSRIRIIGDTDAQRVVDCAFFYLHSSVHPSTLTGMPPFGLSQFRYYYGHSFWDTESWSLLPFVLTNPATARALVDFRRRGLPAAERQAKLYGYRGAQFPWEAAPVGGGFETTPTFAATGWIEQHSSPDFALGLWEYQVATNDASFLREGTWPILNAVAQWIESRGVFTDRGFEIQHIMGPDEGVPNINNNSYMNLICKMVLTAAIRCAQTMGFTPPDAWAKIRDALVLPLDRTKNIVLPYDNPPPAESREYSVGGLDFLIVHDPPISIDLLRNTYQAELAPHGGRPAGALMGTIPHAIGFAVAAMAATAAFLGEKQQAAQLFEASWKESWLDPWGMIREVSTEDYGVFLTDFGSILQTVLLGFTGLRVSEGDWAKYPASLPQGWTRIEVDRLWMRGRPVRLVATDASKAKLLP